MIECNKRLKSMKPSASLQLMTKAKEMQKTDSSVIGLAGGEPDFPTPDRVCMEAVRALSEGDTHYAIGKAIPKLAASIQKKLKEENNAEYKESEILATPGGKNAIYLAVNALVNEGEEVIMFNPAWVSYEPIILSAGGIPVKINLDYENQYKINREILEEAYTCKTKMMIINYPNNPTGKILSKEEAEAIHQFMLAHEDVILLSDEMYEAIVFDGKKSVSMASYKDIKSRVITVNGFSKSSAMTGWRLGYLAAEEALLNPIFKLYQHSVSCVSGFSQRAAAVALEQCKDDIENMRKIYEERRNMFVSTLNKGPGITCEYPDGAFYAWVYFDVKGMNSVEICDYLLENARVVGMPGSANVVGNYEKLNAYAPLSDEGICEYTKGTRE